ncbi:Nn.00g020730.m01.CDS01 [Neocucurbitaria sp. VM-36]
MPHSEDSAIARATLPQKLEAGFLDQYAKLTREQAGHIRHFHNLVTQKDNDWSLMGSSDPGQEWLDGYRYQLATMAYAAGAAHFHRMPALRSLFKTLLEQLIGRMLRREVWGYWFLTSHSGKLVDPDLKELRKPWADPIIRENIMYSGHLLLMVSLYTMLFNDDRYNEEGALTFRWHPIFWGMGPETFSYTRKTLQEAILREMEREKWVGVCCEPNSIFVVCNQFPLIAMRYNDIHDGTDIAPTVAKRYVAAWEEKGMIQENGFIVNWYSPKQGIIRQAHDIGFSAWASAFMNAWNPTFAAQNYKKQSVGFFSHLEEGRVSLNSTPVAFTIRELVANGETDPTSSATLHKAREVVRQRNDPVPPAPPFPRPIFGYVLKWVSELGDKTTIDGLLKHADKYMNPTWREGGLYYSSQYNPSQGEEDKDGNWTIADPFTGNGAIGYARLNVFDGQKKMWEHAWTPEHVSSYPYVDTVNLANSVDFMRGTWDSSKGAMVLTMRTWHGKDERLSLQICNLPSARYGIYVNSQLLETKEVTNIGNVVKLDMHVTGDEQDLVLLQE